MKSIKKLVWSEHKPADGKTCYYDHVDAETPLGLIRISWKGWKEQKSYDFDRGPDYMISDHGLYGHNTLQDAKDAIEESLTSMVNELLGTEQ